MAEGLYHNRLFELASDITPFQNLALDASGEKISRLCGSKVFVAISVDESGAITQIDMDIKACVLGQASAGIFAKYGVGASFDEVVSARDALNAMLKTDGPPPQGRFWELRYLHSVADFPPRHASVLLVFDAAVQAFEKITTTKGDEDDSKYCRA